MALEPAIVAACPGFTPQEVANVLWALGKSRVLAPSAVEALVKETQQNAPRFKPQEITTIISALAILKQGPQQALETIEEQVWTTNSPGPHRLSV